MTIFIAYLLGVATTPALVLIAILFINKFVNGKFWGE